jgi:hypothetical protein
LVTKIKVSSKRAELKKRIKLNISPLKIYSFFQPLFFQRTSAHLQKAVATSTPYFAKELISPLLSVFFRIFCD